MIVLQQQMLKFGKSKHYDSDSRNLVCLSFASFHFAFIIMPKEKCLKIKLELPLLYSRLIEKKLKNRKEGNWSLAFLITNINIKTD